MSESCLFCRIIAKEIPATIVLETEQCVAFRDITPRAPTHVLVVPRVHVDSLDKAQDAGVLGAMLLTAAEVARLEGVASEGYRTVINTNAGAGQTVFHLHAHVLGGRALSWPPG